VRSRSHRCIECYNPSNNQSTQKTGSFGKSRYDKAGTEQDPKARGEKFSYDEIIARNKTSLDITPLKDKSLAHLHNLGLE
jgi:type I restriction enzyme M protein